MNTMTFLQMFTCRCVQHEIPDLEWSIADEEAGMLAQDEADGADDVGDKGGREADA